MSILDDLHKGELYPSEQMIIEDETYRPAEERKEELLELLRGKIDAEGQKLLDELDAKCGHIESIIEGEAFKQGFRVAIRLLLDGLS